MSHFSDMIDKAAKGESLDEVSPPGFKGTVKAMKKGHSDEIDNPYALSWWMKNKGYKSHRKATGGVKESLDSFYPGTQVTIVHGSGIDSGKTGVVVDQREIKTDGRGVPVNVSNNPYKPVDWNEEVAVRFENGELITMYKDRLIPDQNTGGMADEAVGSDGGGYWPGSNQTGISDMDANGIAQRTWGPKAFQNIQKHGSGWMVLAGENDPIGFIQQNGSPLTFNRETGSWTEADGAGGGGSSGITSQIEGGANSVYTGMEPGAYQELLDDGAETFPTEGEGRSTLAASKGLGSNMSCEGIRVEHPEHGLGTILKIDDTNIVVEWDNLQLRLLGPERLKFSEGKYLFRVKEAYSDDPSEVEVGKRKKKKKKGSKVKESGVLATLPGATAAPDEWDERISDDPDDAPTSPEYMAPGGLKGIVDLGVIDSMKDRAHRKDKRHKAHRDSTLLGEGKMTKKKIDEHMIAIQGTFRGSPEKVDYGVDLDLTFNDLVEYELPDPSDSVLTNQTAKGAPKIEPLSVEPGADAAGDGGSPDGDYATDLVPDDAPDVIKYDEMGDEAGNTRDTGEASMGADGSSTTTQSSSESSSEESSSESSSGEYNFSKKEDKSENADDGEEEEDMKESLTWEDLGLVAEEYDEEGGMDEGCSDMNEHEMGQGEVAMTKELVSKLLDAIVSQSPDAERIEDICAGLVAAGGKEDRTLDVGDIAMIMGEIKSAHEGHSEGGAEMEVGNEPEEEMDGGMQVDDEMDSPNSVGDEGCGDIEYEDKAEGDGERAGPEGGDEHEGKTKLMDKKGKMKEQKGGKPISQNTTKGSGPGGGNTGEFGQKDGTVKQVKKGKESGVPGAPLSKEGGGKTVPPISESRVDEQMVAVAMAGIGSVYRGGAEHEAEMDALTEEEKELAMIKRRAGLENWWKK